MARDAEGVLPTGVYGAGKSSVAAELAYLLQERGEAYALLDLGYLGWGGPPGRPVPVPAVAGQVMTWLGW